MARALCEKGIDTVLVNPNIATIQTSEGLADEVYLVRSRRTNVERILEREQCDGILLGFVMESRDCITICEMENFDPIGKIALAPSVFANSLA